MLESGSAEQTHVPLTAAIVPPWAAALLAAALYPSLLTLFPIAIQRMSAAENAVLQSVWIACAIAAMALLFSVPLLALWALLKVPARATPKAPAQVSQPIGATDARMPVMAAWSPPRITCRRE